MPRPSHAGDPLSVASMTRTLLGAGGLALTMFGGLGAVRLFFAVLEFVRDPRRHAEWMRAWADALGVAEARIEVAGAPIPMAGPLAMLFLFLSAYVLMHLLISILKAGLKLLSWARDGAKPAEPAAPPSA